MAETDLIKRGTVLAMLNELKAYARTPAEKRMVRRALWTVARRVPAVEGDLIDRKAVYERACKGCIRQGNEPGVCYSEDPCERLVREFSSADPVIRNTKEERE